MRRDLIVTFGLLAAIALAAIPWLWQAIWGWMILVMIAGLIALLDTNPWSAKTNRMKAVVVFFTLIGIILLIPSEVIHLLVHCLN